MGEMIIPKLDASLPIIHDTNEDELEKGVAPKRFVLVADLISSN